MLRNEALTIALDSLNRNKLRVCPAISGVIAGSADIALVVTASLTERRYAKDQIEGNRDQESLWSASDSDSQPVSFGGAHHQLGRRAGKYSVGVNGPSICEANVAAVNHIAVILDLSTAGLVYFMSVWIIFWALTSKSSGQVGSLSIAQVRVAGRRTSCLGNIT